MMDSRTFNANDYSYINELYLNYRRDTSCEEAKEALKDAMADYAFALAQCFPGREDTLGNLGEIYIIIDEFATAELSSNFVADVYDIVNKRFSKTTPANA